MVYFSLLIGIFPFCALIPRRVNNFIPTYRDSSIADGLVEETGDHFIPIYRDFSLNLTVHQHRKQILPLLIGIFLSGNNLDIRVADILSLYIGIILCESGN